MKICDITVCLAVSDFDQSRSLYKGLGLAIETDEFIGIGLIEHPFRRLRVTVPGSPVFIEFLPECQPHLRVPMITFGVVDLRLAREYLLEQPGITELVEDELPYAKLLTFKDPAQNIIQMIQNP